MDELAPFDLLAIGGGLAGLVAALRAAELGLRTAVIEKGARTDYPCSSRHAGGIFHVSYHDVKLQPDTLVTAIEKATGGGADPALARAVADNAGRAVDWLAIQGAQFVQGSPTSWHRYVVGPQREAVAGPDWRDRGPDRLVDRLREQLEARQGKVLLDTRAVALHLGRGRCGGVVVQSGGRQRMIPASAVVIADGGFPADAELLRRFIGPHPDRVLTRNAGTAAGDGLRIAEAAGAAIVGADRFYGHLLSRDAMTNGGLSPYPQIDAVAAAAIVVDDSGRRFIDEGHGGIAAANALARLDDPLCGTVVCDASIWERAGRAALIPPNPQLEAGGGTLHRADTLAELARVAGLDIEGLAATVAAYNTALSAGTPAALTPARTIGSAGATAIEMPPFVAIPICAGITNTMGGIGIDGNARVLRPDGSTIAGLYAAGGATGGLEGGGDSVGYVGGLIKAVVFGLRAAEHAAANRMPD